MSSSTTSTLYDTIIIGAGWSGSVAAQILAKSGRSVLVLEARDRVGGRARTWSGKSSAEAEKLKIDLGCSWIHGYKEGNPTGAIAKELGVIAHLPKPADNVIYTAEGALPTSTANSLRASLNSAQASLKLPYPVPSPSLTLASGLFSPTSALYTNLPSPTLSSHATSLARMLEIPLGLKLESASLRWAGWESTTNFAGSDAAPEGGYEALVGKVLQSAVDTGKAKVETSKKVIGIKQGNETGKEVSVVTADGTTFNGRTVVCTIPLGVLKKLSDDFFSPPLPPHLQDTIKGTHVGILEKLLLHYPSAWWPGADTLGGYTFLPTRDESTLTSSSKPEEIFSASTLVCANFASGTLPGSSPTLLTYLSETPAKLLLGYPVETVAKAYHTFLVNRLGVSEPVPEPIEFEMTSWLTDEHALGATTTPSIASMIGERSPMDFKELGRPVWGGKLGFAGEHTEMENRGSVAGAVLSGQREAARVDRLLSLLT